MKKTFGKLALAALLSFVPLSSASAYSYSIDYASTLDSQSILTTTVAGAIVYDFDNLTPTYSGQGTVVTGNNTGRWAEPGLTDGTKYFVAPDSGTGGTATITFSQKNSYLGLYWGSIDSYNHIVFYNGTQLLFSIGGTDVTNPVAANGNQGDTGTNKYVNIYASDFVFDRIDIQSVGANAFELDNLSVKPVPEPATMLLFGTGIAGLAGIARRRKTN